MSTVKVDYFLRLSGRFGSFTTGAVTTGAGAAAGGGAPKSTAGAAKLSPALAGIGSGAGSGAVYIGVGCETSGDGVIHCGCSGTLVSGAVPNPVIFPRHRFPVQLLFLYRESMLRYLG